MEDRKKLENRAKAYGLKNLAQDVGVSRQALHGFFSGGDMKLSNFERLLSCLGWTMEVSPQEALEDVLGNLKLYGAPLLVDDPEVYLSLEETLYKALALSRKEARVASVLPYLLVLKSYALKAEKLLDLFRDETSSLQLLGYYLDVALSFRYRKPLANLLRKIEKREVKLKSFYLRESDEGRNPKLYKRFENDPAKKWKVLTRDNLEDLVQRFRKWEREDAAA